MKSFNIYANTLHIYKIIADSFPKVSTLLFNNINYTKISYYCTMQLYMFLSLLSKAGFLINENYLELLLYCVNNVIPVKTKITVAFSSKIYQTDLFLGTTSFIINIINNIKILFNNTNTTTLTASATVGKFNILGTFDPQTLGALDNKTLDNMDFEST